MIKMGFCLQLVLSLNQELVTKTFTFEAYFKYYKVVKVLDCSNLLNLELCYQGSL